MYVCVSNIVLDSERPKTTGRSAPHSVHKFQDILYDSNGHHKFDHIIYRKQTVKQCRVCYLVQSQKKIANCVDRIKNL